MEISIVIPVYNEQKSAKQTIEKVKETIKTINKKIEIIVVNDNSTDNTKTIVENIKGIKVINHNINTAIPVLI